MLTLSIPIEDKPPRRFRSLIARLKALDWQAWAIGSMAVIVTASWAVVMIRCAAFLWRKLT